MHENCGCRCDELRQADPDLPCKRSQLLSVEKGRQPV
jgi:hypothetical protein